VIPATSDRICNDAPRLDAPSHGELLSALDVTDRHKLSSRMHGYAVEARVVRLSGEFDSGH
jgi:hypothetical protein